MIDLSSGFLLSSYLIFKEKHPNRKTFLVQNNESRRLYFAFRLEFSKDDYYLIYIHGPYDEGLLQKSNEFFIIGLVNDVN